MADLRKAQLDNQIAFKNEANIFTEIQEMPTVELTNLTHSRLTMSNGDNQLVSLNNLSEQLTSIGATVTITSGVDGKANLEAVGGPASSNWNRIDQGTSDYGLIPKESGDDSLVDQAGRHKAYDGTNYNNLSVNAVPEEVTVGYAHCDYTDFSTALASITDASYNKPYTIKGSTDFYNTVINTNKSYVFLDGRNCAFDQEIDVAKDMRGYIGFSRVYSGVGLYCNLASAVDSTEWSIDRIESYGTTGCTVSSGTLNLLCNYAYHNANDTNDEAGAYGYNAGLGGGYLNAITNLILTEANDTYTSYGIATRDGLQTHIVNSILGHGAGTTVAWWARDDSHQAFVIGNFIGGDKCLDWNGGENGLMVNALTNSLGHSSTIDGSNTNYITANYSDTDLTIGVGATLYAMINRYSGTLTNNGTINGMIGNDFYGAKTFKNNVVFDNPVSFGGQTKVFGANLIFEVTDTWAEDKTIVTVIKQTGLPDTTYTNRPTIQHEVYNSDAVQTEVDPGYMLSREGGGLIVGFTPVGNMHSPFGIYQAINSYYDNDFKVGATGYAHLSNHDNSLNSYDKYISVSNVADSHLKKYAETTVLANDYVNSKLTGLHEISTVKDASILSASTYSTGIVAFYGQFNLFVGTTSTTRTSVGVALSKGDPVLSITSSLINEDMIDFTTFANKDVGAGLNVYIDSADNDYIKLKNNSGSTFYFDISCIVTRAA